MQASAVATTIAAAMPSTSDPSRCATVSEVAAGGNAAIIVPTCTQNGSSLKTSASVN